LRRTSPGTALSEAVDQVLDRLLDVAQLVEGLRRGNRLGREGLVAARGLGYQAQGVAQFVEQGGSAAHSAGHLREGDLADDRVEGIAKSKECSMDSPIPGRQTPESIDGGANLSAAVVEIQIGPVEGQA
jgi:hypothetical protein